MGTGIWITAAEKVTTEQMAFMIKYSSAPNIHNDSNQIPMRYYPNMTNRLYAYMRIITVRHFYTFGTCLIGGNKGYQLWQQYMTGERLDELSLL
ncbi:hypothetical protein BC941DRAFT_472919 [Chlamydoabsidia padenii]|nr:hypothetical protein BC941DRAFT_472919 [Chlamydoabsidia padenii]